MPPYIWLNDPIELIQKFENRHKHPDAGALIAWGVWAVECLHYLDDVDLAFEASQLMVAGHKPDIVDVAHARWATGTCITALDLCAASLGRAICGHTGPREFDLSYFDPAGKASTKIQARRAQLPLAAKQWVDSVLADPDYNEVKSARDWLTHSRLKRHLFVGAPGPPQRLSLELPSNKLPVRKLIQMTRDLATRHVSDFLQIVPYV
jgi:hypothetical protein